MCSSFLTLNATVKPQFHAEKANRMPNAISPYLPSRKSSGFLPTLGSAVVSPCYRPQSLEGLDFQHDLA